MATLTITSMIVRVASLDEIRDCFPLLQELRPKLQDIEAVSEQIERQIGEGYTLVYIRDQEEVGACMGYRFFETLAWGKVLYIDDLITREKSRKKGFGSLLLDYAKEQAHLAGCDEIHLDSGHTRFDAHRLYLDLGFKITCHHFGLEL